MTAACIVICLPIALDWAFVVSQASKKKIPSLSMPWSAMPFLVLSFMFGTICFDKELPFLSKLA